MKSIILYVLLSSAGLLAANENPDPTPPVDGIGSDDLILIDQLHMVADICCSLDSKQVYRVHKEIGRRAMTEALYEGFGAFVNAVEEILCFVKDKNLREQLARLELRKVWLSSNIYAKSLCQPLSPSENYWEEILIEFRRLRASESDKVKKIADSCRDRLARQEEPVWNSLSSEELGADLTCSLQEQLSKYSTFRQVALEELQEQYRARLARRETRRIALQAQAGQKNAQIQEEKARKDAWRANLCCDHGKLIEECFPKPDEKRIVFWGITAVVTAEMVDYVKALIESLEKELAVEAKEDNAVEHLYIFSFKIVHCDELVLKTQVSVGIKCSFLNSVEYRNFNCQPLKFCRKTHVPIGTKKPAFLHAMRQICSEEIFQVKKRVFARALCPDNVEHLYAISRQVLATHPVSCLKDNGGTYLPARGQKPLI